MRRERVAFAALAAPGSSRVPVPTFVSLCSTLYVAANASANPQIESAMEHAAQRAIDARIGAGNT
jgi:hypothetical protein